MLQFMTIAEAMGIMATCRQLRSIVRGALRARVFSVFEAFFSLVQLRQMLKNLAVLGGCFFGTAPALVLAARFDRRLQPIHTLHIALPNSAADCLSEFILQQLGELDPSRKKYALVGTHYVPAVIREKVGYSCIAEFRCLVSTLSFGK